MMPLCILICCVLFAQIVFLASTASSQNNLEKRTNLIDMKLNELQDSLTVINDGLIALNGKASALQASIVTLKEASSNPDVPEATVTTVGNIKSNLEAIATVIS